MSRGNPRSPILIKHTVELMKDIGESKSLTITTISGFNSNIEDYLSGNCVALMIYYFSLHYAKTFLEPLNDEATGPEFYQPREQPSEISESKPVELSSG
jgi:hypothetical protein